MTDRDDCDHPEIVPQVSRADPETELHVMSATHTDDGLVVFSECRQCGKRFDREYEYVATNPAA